LSEIRNSGGTAEAVKCDVSNYSDVENMIKNIVTQYNRIDIIVNNAGITKDTLIMRMGTEDFDKVIDINLKGTFNTIQCASRYMIKQKSGKIINIATVVGITGNA
jgi:3-oxoacyl-[acyl-carrier protein] reductase